MHARSKVDPRPFALGVVCLIASGCAAGISNQPHGRGAGEWSVTLPTAASYSQGLAYGKGGSPLPDKWVDLDDVARPTLADARPAHLRSDSSKKKAIRKQADEQPTSTVPQQQPVTPAAPPAASNERTELALADTTRPQQADASMLGRYAERQSQSQDQQKFRGGDAIVIGASTLVIVLLVVLLLVLLL